ncbi:putative vesicular glutamate transporter eat-4 [Aphelenchoides besseyi]|nr:putative vesicular glutamate transporter eat-4 [Aphelenchoides besseyi]
MAGQIPATLQGVQNRFVDQSKQMFNSYGQPISNFFNSKANGGSSVNEHEMTRMNENSGSAVIDGATITREDGLDVHANLMLKTVDSIGWMKCSKRWQLAALANIGFMIVFGIRCNFGAAKNYMGRDYVDPWGKKHHGEFNWTRAELGVMESSFFYGYLVTQVPAGFLAAKFPANKMFGIAIGGAAVLNLLLPYAFRTRSDVFVATVQILQGLVQGMGYPSMHGVWRHWAPPLERSKLATTAFAGSYAGAVFGLPLSAWLVSYVGWSTPFYTYVIWAFLWFSLTFEKPAYHPTISHQEKTYIEEQIGHVSHTSPSFSTIPWKAILTSKPVYAIIVANFARSWTFYLLLQNQLTYMRDVLGMKINDSGVPAALPHAVMGIIVVAGGQLADNLRSSGRMSTTTVRKVFNCGGFGGEAFFMLFVAYTRSERVALISLILAVGCSGFAISGFNVNHLDIAPRYAAILMGFSNGIGTLAGLTCPFVTELLTAKGPHGWVTVFLLASLIHFTGVTFYAIYASGDLQDWAEPKEEETSWKEGNGTVKPPCKFRVISQKSSRIQPVMYRTVLLENNPFNWHLYRILMKFKQNE